MVSLRHPLVLFGATLVLVGCSLFLRYDVEGQPCDGDRCLPGFVCIEEKCQRSEEPRDAGSSCECAEGQRCPTGPTACIPDSCATRICPVGQRCEGPEGSTACVSVAAPALGHACNSDQECAAPGGGTRFCWRSAIQQPVTGALRPGICVEPCVEGVACTTPGALCTTLRIGLDAGTTSVCTGDVAFRACGSEGECNGEGLVCTVYDHPRVGPATLCDRPLLPGAAVGEICSTTPGNAPLCADGLCVPRLPPAGGSATCAQVCDETSCPTGMVCQLSQFGIQRVLRHLPFCVPASTTCRDCSAAATTCAADAPVCTPVGATSRCLAECTPDAGTFPSCPSGLKCTSVVSGFRCMPPTGICP